MPRDARRPGGRRRRLPRRDGRHRPRGVADAERPGRKRGGRDREPRRELPEREVWIGLLERRGKRSRVTPYRDDALWQIQVSRPDLAGAEDGQVVVLEPVQPRKGRRASRRVPSRGRVIEVLGRPGDAEADFRAVVWRRQLPVEFPEEALREAEALPEQLDPAEVARRVDLRDRSFVTIDPATARDHDDAVCVEREREGFRLWVAIADVSHYVAEGSVLDHEALRRGNSVYFPDRAIPMLPERLSARLCSLRPEEDKLALTVELRIDGRGRVRRRSFYPAVLRSRARLVYEDAAERMQSESHSQPLDAQLAELAAVARVLQRRRFARGSLDFDLPTAEIVLGDDLRPVDLVEAPRSVAHRAIEEAMLVANRTVAETLVAARFEAIFRNHEAPLPEDLENLRELLSAFRLPGGRGEEWTPQLVARALAEVAERPEERLVHHAVLRSMRQARYDVASRGHFALAFEHYLHFTSPIRRYADLVCHRALKQLLEDGRRAPASPGRLQRVADRLSLRERLAMDAEREVVDLKKCVFMAERLGREYEGTVSGVAPHGIYVTLDALFVDGLVHVSRLPGYFHFDERAHALVDHRSRLRLRLGDRLRVRVVAADPVRGRIDFAPLGELG